MKKILLTLIPIIREGKIDDAAAVSADDFTIAYRTLTENTSTSESVITPTTPIQLPYLPKLDPYTALLREGD
ncbi:hypothetical protein FACS1894105_09320 [Clostridia bacterium]|nr:hypothetical protein FACS1894105_09320 [Clostridia bacterium]